MVRETKKTVRSRKMSEKIHEIGFDGLSAEEIAKKLFSSFKKNDEKNIQINKQIELTNERIGSLLDSHRTKKTVKSVREPAVKKTEQVDFEEQTPIGSGVAFCEMFQNEHISFSEKKCVDCDDEPVQILTETVVDQNEHVEVEGRTQVEHDVAFFSFVQNENVQVDNNEHDVCHDVIEQVQSANVDSNTTTTIIMNPKRKHDDCGPSGTLVWFYKQDDAFETYSPGCRFLACDTVFGKQNKKYCKIELNQIEALIQYTPQLFRNFYEIFTIYGSIEFNTKLFFDYDNSGVIMSLEEKQCVLQKIRDDTTVVFHKYFNIDLTIENFVEMDSSTEYKTSFHVIVDGYHFKNVEVLKILMKTYLKDLFQFFNFADIKNPILDNRVYSKNRVFRMLGCTKYGKNAFLQLMTQHTFEQTLVTNITSESVFINVTEDIMNIKVPKAPRRTNFEIEIVETIKQLLVSKVNDTTSEFCREQSKADAYYFKTRGSRVCPHGVTHHGNNFFVNHDRIKGQLIYMCLGCTKPFVLGRVNGTQVVEDEFIDDLGVKTDLEAATHLYEDLYPYWVCCDDELYVFDDDTGMWDNTTNVHFKILSKFDDKLRLVTWNEKQSMWKQNTKGYGNDTVLMRKMLPLLKSKCIDNHWFTNNMCSSLGKLLFTNGILDMRTGVFRNEFDPDIMFLARMHIKYKELNDDGLKYMMDVKNRMFDVPLGSEVGDYFCLNLARGLAGDCMKRFLFGIGPTNSGKSTLVKACELSFGEYIGNFNAESIAYRDNSADEASAMRWVLLLQSKRIIFSNEIKANVELDGNCIKKLSSGGDKIIGRKHYQSENPFKPHFLACVMSNDLNKINPYDDAVDDRVRVISYEKSFVNNPSNEYELQKDVGLDDEMQTPEFQRVFMMLLINRYLEFNKAGRVDYEPEAVKTGKHEWIGLPTDTDFISKFKVRFNITNNPDDFVRFTEIEAWVSSMKLGITVFKFLNELKKHCKLNNLEHVTRRVKKFKGSRESSAAWFGIAHYDDNDFL